MITAGPVLELIFLAAVGVIWLMIGYQIVLSVGGALHRYASAKKTQELLEAGGELPAVSVLVPARNEEVVIEGTLRAILAMDVPADRLEVIVIDDGSTDATAAKVEAIARADGRVRLLSLPVQDRGRGKSHALNQGLAAARHDRIAVFDADNRPERDSLRILALHLDADPGLAAALGKFRTINRDRTFLTRCIHVETLAFQWIVQAGRAHFFHVGILPGTNFIIRRDALEACGGWDEAAITEDTELSIRLYAKGWRIAFVPEAVTWEEEPERFGVWLRQRTRWVRGNFYVLRKFLRASFRFRNRFLALELFYLSVLYYLFLGAIGASHAFFIACATGLLRVAMPGPYTLVWIAAFVLYMAEIALVLSYEEEERPANLIVAALMYITYCQGWILIVLRALFREYVLREGRVWDKTERFGSAPTPIEGGGS